MTKATPCPPADDVIQTAAQAQDLAFAALALIVIIVVAYFFW